MSSPYAFYDEDTNTLQVIRARENITRTIRCNNLRPAMDKVHGVTIDGDEIYVFVGPHNNPRPTHKLVYSFLSLAGGRRESL